MSYYFYKSIVKSLQLDIWNIMIDFIISENISNDDVFQRMGVENNTFKYTY